MIAHQCSEAPDRVAGSDGRRWHRRSPASLARDLVAGLGHYLRCRRDYRRLEDLPDYLLDDIGLTRADIAAAPRRLPR